MALESTTTEPKLEDFTPLSEHQEQTPNTFWAAKPVLHLHSPDISLGISIADLTAQPALEPFGSESLKIAEGLGSVPANDAGSTVISGLDIWVTSKQLTLFAPQIPHGAHIPYQSIVVHAAEGNEVLLGLNLSDNNTPDEDMSFIQLRITPRTSTKHPANHSADASEQSNLNGEPDLALFNAISACQELNPDSLEEGEGEEGGFDATAPGATGWITSENMADFVGEDGEFRMPEGVTVVGGAEEDGVNGTNGANGVNGLGEGAGRTRRADEVDGIDGEEDEGKWQRTG